MAGLDRDTIFLGLTRPQMFAGVSYNYLVINGIATTEAFLLLKSPWVLALALGAHAAGYLTCLREPRFFDLWLVKTSRCPRLRSHRVWRCNSYRA